MAMLVYNRVIERRRGVLDMAVQRRPKTTPKTTAPAQEEAPEKTPAVLEMEAWYKKFTAREDVREIMTRLAQ